MDDPLAPVTVATDGEVKGAKAASAEEAVAKDLD